MSTDQPIDVASVIADHAMAHQLDGAADTVPVYDRRDGRYVGDALSAGYVPWDERFKVTPLVSFRSRFRHGSPQRRAALVEHIARVLR